MAKQTGQPSPAEATTDAPTSESIVIQELRGVIETQKGLIGILSKQMDTLLNQPRVVETAGDKPKTTVEVIQINMDGKKYFCTTQEEQRVFDVNHPGSVTESFTIELEGYIAKKYLDNPDNARHFKAAEPTVEPTEGEKHDS